MNLMKIKMIYMMIYLKNLEMKNILMKMNMIMMIYQM